MSKRPAGLRDGYMHALGLAPAPADAPQAAAPAPVARTAKITAALDATLVTELRAAVAQLGGAPTQLTVTAVIDAGVRRELERLRKAHNGGEPFTDTGHRPRRGRPLKR